MGVVTPAVKEDRSAGYNLLDPIWTLKIISTYWCLMALAFMIAGLTQLRCFGFWWCCIPFVITALVTLTLCVSVCHVIAPSLATTLRRYVDVLYETGAIRYYLSALALVNFGYVISVYLGYKMETESVWGKLGGYYLVVAGYAMLVQAFFGPCVLKLAEMGEKREDVESGPPRKVDGDAKP